MVLESENFWEKSTPTKSVMFSVYILNNINVHASILLILNEVRKRLHTCTPGEICIPSSYPFFIRQADGTFSLFLVGGEEGGTRNCQK